MPKFEFNSNTPELDVSYPVQWQGCILSRSRRRHPKSNARSTATDAVGSTRSSALRWFCHQFPRARTRPARSSWISAFRGTGTTAPSIAIPLALHPYFGSTETATIVGDRSSYLTTTASVLQLCRQRGPAVCSARARNTCDMRRLRRARSWAR